MYHENILDETRNELAPPSSPKGAADDSTEAGDAGAPNEIDSDDDDAAARQAPRSHVENPHACAPTMHNSHSVDELQGKL